MATFVLSQGLLSNLGRGFSVIFSTQAHLGDNSCVLLLENDSRFSPSRFLFGDSMASHCLIS